MRGLFLFCLTFAILAGCGAPEEKPAPASGEAELTSAVWRWTGVEGPGAAPVLHPNRYTVEFLPDGRYAVRADCNSGSGTWARERGSFRMTAGPMTMAACGEESLDVRFLGLLAQASAVARDAGSLTITSGESVLQFEAMPRIGLAGTAWLVRAVNNGQGAVTSVLEDSELTVGFGEDGRVSGSAGCNRFTGSYEVVAQTLSFSPLATTRRMCMGEGIVEQEQYFLDALASVASWEIRGGRAQLRSIGGALAVDLISAVTGVAIVTVREALPPDANLTVQLLDVSRADAEAKVLGEHSRALDGNQSPWPFEVGFDPAEIDARMSYALRATITRADEQMFTTTRHYPVLTRDGDQFGVEIQLDAAGN